jgi:hypothetical protein
MRESGQARARPAASVRNNKRHPRALPKQSLVYEFIA